jgi:hypothetical protein
VIVGCVLLLAACGGGGGGSGTGTPPTSTSAPSGLSYPSPQAFTVGKAVSGVVPTVTGTVTSYAVTPQLPAGLALDQSSGAISGTPTAITAVAAYTVTATNSGGSATFQVSIAVNDVTPTVSYLSGTVALAQRITIAKLTPAKSTGGVVTSWSVSPALPAGLNFNTQDGTITGAPTGTSPAAAYTVAASNSGGQATFVLNISVQTGTLLDLGHADPLTSLRFDGVHVISEDSSGHWALWNYTSGALIASGDSGCAPMACPHGLPADVAGTVAVIQTPTGFDLRSASDGHLIASPSFAISSWNLASDGSYFSAQGAAGLSAWSASGGVLITRTGDYSKAVVFASPTAIQVAAGAAGANVVETIDVASTNSSIGPAFSGAFSRWFATGDHFITQVGNTSTIYSSASMQQQIIALADTAGIQGAGNWFWHIGGSNVVDIYALGGTTPAASFSALSGLAQTSATTLGLLGDPTSVKIIDLSGGTPTMSSFPIPITGSSVYAASSAAHWLVGNQLGVILDGGGLPATARYLSYGRALSITGSDSRVAVSTASGRIVYFDATSLSLQGTLQQFSAKLQLSTDGSVLAAQGSNFTLQSTPDYSLNVYALPANTLTAHWPYGMVNPTAVAVPYNMVLSGSGTVLGQVLSNNTRQVSGIDPGSGVIWMDTLSGTLRLSPNGTLIAAETGNDPTTDGANIVNNGVLTKAVAGWPVGWMDNDRLITNIYDPTQAHIGGQIYQHATIYDHTGTTVGTSMIPEVHEFQPLTADTLYSDELNSILSLSTGATAWMSGDSPRGIGAVAGQYVVFSSGARVLALAH